MARVAKSSRFANGALSLGALSPGVPSLTPHAVEEFLRFFSVANPVRRAVRDVEVGSTLIRGGDRLFLVMGCADRDEAEFEDAGCVRFDRAVNRHIAFGGGIHRCLGSHLARMELRVALREWHRRIPEYSVEPGHTLVYTANIRSIEHFPMRFVAAP